VAVSKKLYVLDESHTRPHCSPSRSNDEFPPSSIYGRYDGSQAMGYFIGRCCIFQSFDIYYFLFVTANIYTAIPATIGAYNGVLPDRWRTYFHG
jgi:hypothetical protein